MEHRTPSQRAARALPPGVEEVLGLAGDSIEGSVDIRMHAIEPQYCTTNEVFALGSLVFKRYRQREAHLVETQVLRARERFGFRMPRLLFSHASTALGSWNVLERVDGRTLVDACPDGMWLELVVDRMVEALAEFEIRVRSVPDVPFSRWLWVQGVDPLAHFCRARGASSLADMLQDIASRSDALLHDSETVPCFDLYARNVIWGVKEGLVNVTFVDFDKASRLVPAGEQLSHIAMIPGLRALLPRAMSRYAELSGRSVGSIEGVVGMACFFRALSGVRDSLHWSGRSGGDVDVRDPHADARQEALQYALTAAEELSSAVRGTSGPGLGTGTQLREAVSQLRWIVDGHRWP